MNLIRLFQPVGRDRVKGTERDYFPALGTDKMAGWGWGHVKANDSYDEGTNH